MSRFPQNLFPRGKMAEGSPRLGCCHLTPTITGELAESRFQCFFLKCCFCMSAPGSLIGLQPVYRRDGLRGINLREAPYIKIFCVEKKLYNPSPHRPLEKAFYFLKGMLLKSFQPRLCRALQRTFSGKALGRQCQNTLDFEALI